MVNEARFDPRAILETLVKHDVRFIVIGGLAANVYGSALLTKDLDVCYERTNENINRLVESLLEMKATLRGFPEGLPFVLDAGTIKLGDSFTFDTIFGSFDCLGTPSGSGGYPQLIRTANERSLGGVKVFIAHLDDLIRMKTAAGRAKDLEAVENLVALRDEIEGIPDDWEWKSGP